MSSKRHDVQEFIEYNLGCTDLNIWKNYLPSLLNFTIDAPKKSSLENCIESDVTSYFYKAAYSFVQALSNVRQKNYNWSIVQFYYSCFYAIRADILLSNHCIVRCNGLYIAENQIGEKFNSVRINNIRGDHQLAIALLKRLKENHKITDEILDIQLEGTDAYSWLMKHREKSNYQSKDFSDPEIYDLFNHIDSYFRTKTINDLLKFYTARDYNICFDVDHSVVSIPFKKLMQVKAKIQSKYGLRSSDNLKHYLYLKAKLLELGFTKQDVKDFI